MVTHATLANASSVTGRQNLAGVPVSCFRTHLHISYFVGERELG